MLVACFLPRYPPLIRILLLLLLVTCYSVLSSLVKFLLPMIEAAAFHALVDFNRAVPLHCVHLVSRETWECQVYSNDAICSRETQLIHCCTCVYGEHMHVLHVWNDATCMYAVVKTKWTLNALGLGLGSVWVPGFDEINRICSCSWYTGTWSQRNDWFRLVRVVWYAWMACGGWWEA